jgi:hypothetical protein
MAPIRLTRTVFGSGPHDGGLQPIQLLRAGVIARAVQRLAAFRAPAGRQPWDDAYPSLPVKM